MSFISTFRGSTIRKASKVRKPAGYRRLEALNKKMSNAVQINLLRGVKTFKKKIDQEELFQAWKTGDYRAVERVIPWDSMSEDVNLDALDTTVFAASDVAIELLPGSVADSLRFDTSNHRITNYINERTTSLITDLRQGSEEVIKEAVTQSFNQALTPERVASRIRGSVGLYPRLERAVERYRDGLLASGAPAGRTELLTESYRGRLLDYRASSIARTEVRRAVDNGQLAVWKQSVDQGAFNKRTTKKVWIIDGDPCPICIQMDGQAVGLYDQWVVKTPNGIVLCDVPCDIHPFCLCTMKLEFDDSFGEVDQPQDQENDDEQTTEEE